MAQAFIADTFYIWMTRTGNGPWRPMYTLSVVAAERPYQEYCVRVHNERGRHKRPREEHAIFRFSADSLAKVYPEDYPEAD